MDISRSLLLGDDVIRSTVYGLRSTVYGLRSSHVGFYRVRSFDSNFRSHATFLSIYLPRVSSCGENRIRRVCRPKAAEQREEEMAQ